MRRERCGSYYGSGCAVTGVASVCVDWTKWCDTCHHPSGGWMAGDLPHRGDLSKSLSCVALHDRRRGLWFHADEAGGTIELFAGREGDDAYVKLPWSYELYDVLTTARWAREIGIGDAAGDGRPPDVAYHNQSGVCCG